MSNPRLSSHGSLWLNVNVARWNLKDMHERWANRRRRLVISRTISGTVSFVITVCISMMSGCDQQAITKYEGSQASQSRDTVRSGPDSRSVEEITIRVGVPGVPFAAEKGKP